MIVTVALEDAEMASLHSLVAWENLGTGLEAAMQWSRGDCFSRHWMVILKAFSAHVITNGSEMLMY